MKFLGIIPFALISAVIAFVNGNYYKDPLRFQVNVDVFQPELGSGFQTLLQEIPGFRSCGGQGELLSLRNLGCLLPEVPCLYPSDGRLRPYEVEFIPSEDAEALGVRLILLADGLTQIIYERAISNSSVKGGRTTILSSMVASTKQLKGKVVSGQYIIYRVSDNRVEICVESDYQVI